MPLNGTWVAAVTGNEMSKAPAMKAAGPTMDRVIEAISSFLWVIRRSGVI
jgi:hypothetical protein